MILRLALLALLAGPAFAQTPTLVIHPSRLDFRVYRPLDKTVSLPYHIRLTTDGSKGRPQAACTIEYKGAVLASRSIRGTSIFETKGTFKINSDVKAVQLRCQVDGYLPVLETVSLAGKGLEYETCLSATRLYQQPVVDLETGHAQVRIKVPTFRRERVLIDGNSFLRLVSDDPDIQSGSYNGDEALPEFPQATFFFALPLDAEVTGISVKTGETTDSIDSLLVPAASDGPAYLKAPLTPAFDKESYYGRMPEVSADRDTRYEVIVDREKNLVKVTAPLVDYSLKKPFIRFFSDMAITVNFKANSRCFRAPFSGGDAIDVLRSQTVVGLKQMILNPIDVQSVCREGAVINSEFRRMVPRMERFAVGASSPNLIIVASSQFRDQAEEFRVHKETLGIRTQILDWNGGSAEQLKAVLNKYATVYRPNAMQWVLLLGDVDTIPTFYDVGPLANGNGDDAATAGDAYYIQYGANYTPSLAPDLSIGRIPAKNTDELKVVLERIRQYELNPPTLDSYYQSPTLAGTLQMNGSTTTGIVGNYADRAEKDMASKLFSTGFRPERIYRGDTEGVDHPENWVPGVPIDYTTLEAQQNLNPPQLFHMDGSQKLIDSAWQRGTDILIHRGHGAIDRWVAPEYMYSAERYSEFSATLPPMVFAVSCLTGFFDSETVAPYITAPSSTFAGKKPDQHYLAESMLMSPNGVLGIMASSRQSSSGYNDRLLRGLARSLVDKKVNDLTPLSQHLGDIATDAKVFTKVLKSAVLTSDQLESANRHHLLTYNLLGDPSLELRQNLPLRVRGTPTVNYDGERQSLTIRFKMESLACPGCDLKQQRDQPIAVVMDSENQVLARAIATPITTESGENREIVLNGVTGYYNALLTVHLSNAGLIPYPVTIDNRGPIIR